MFFALAVILISLNQSYGQSFGECAKTPVIEDFNATNYFGKWYEIQRFEYIFEKDLICVNANYGSINSTTVSVNNYGFNTVTQKEENQSGYAVVTNATEPNKLKVSFPVVIANSTFYPPSYSYEVITTDYKSYSLVYSCLQIIEHLLKFEIVWILSRNKTLDDKIVQNLIETTKSYNIDVSKFVVCDQSCT